MGEGGGDFLGLSMPSPALRAAGPAPARADAAAGASKTGGAASETGFGNVLSMLNPLQYVPVVGMIYRAVTGDTIPEGARIAGGLIFSGLTGGPVGLVMTAAADVAEEALGIDPDKIVHSALASIGLAAPQKGAPQNKPVLEAGAPAARTAADKAAARAAIPVSVVAQNAPLAPAATRIVASVATDQMQAAARRNAAYAWTLDPVIGQG